MDAGPDTGSCNNGTSDIEVWDTRCFQANAFTVFREAICSTFMPWSPEIEPGRRFEGRVEGATLVSGAVGLVQMTPITAVRNRLNLANSPISCFYANYVLAGELNVEQGGRSVTAKRGDLAVYDSTTPVVLSERNDARFENLAFLIPKHSLGRIRDPESHLHNIVIPFERMIRPLSSALMFIAKNLHTMSRDELNALFDASVSLLQVASGCFENDDETRAVSASANRTMSEILAFVHSNLANPAFSVQHAANQLGISIRYVHKLFATTGTTFSTYLTAKRLDHVKCDLLVPEMRHQPITMVAYRWGFEDLSTFNRLFKARFGMTPSQARSGCP